MKNQSSCLLVVEPVHQKHIDQGGRAGWALYSLSLPYSDDLPYNASAVDFYYSWDQFGKSNPAKLWQEVHPDKSDSYIMDMIYNSRRLARQDVWKLVDMTD